MARARQRRKSEQTRIALQGVNRDAKVVFAEIAPLYPVEQTPRVFHELFDPGAILELSPQELDGLAFVLLRTLARHHVRHVGNDDERAIEAAFLAHERSKRHGIVTTGRFKAFRDLIQCELEWQNPSRT